MCFFKLRWYNLKYKILGSKLYNMKYKNKKCIHDYII